MKPSYLRIAPLLNPCKKIAKFFIKLRRHRRRSKSSTKHERRRGRFWRITSLFRRAGRDEGEMDRVTELTSFSVHQQHQQQYRGPHPSPLTPAYVRASGGNGKEEEDVEEACRSFEKYVMEMMVEEGKVRDLGDVEELLYLWKELKSPVFLDLVCRFYRELCNDLFSSFSPSHFTNKY